MNKQLGVSLSEILISLFLSSMIITLLMQFYLSSKQQYSEAQEILATNFDLHWVGVLLSDSVRRAGFTPCLGVDQLEVLDHRAAGTVIQGLKILNQPQQSIYINRMSEHFAKVKSISSRTELIMSEAVVFPKNRPVLIADCTHAEVHQIANFGHSRLSLEKPLLFDYTTPTYIGELIEERWFIKTNKKGEKSLYYHLGQTEEVTSLVHSLVVENHHRQGKPLLKVIMGLAHGKTYELWMAVRGS
jgi:hypothetical protein